MTEPLTPSMSSETAGDLPPGLRACSDCKARGCSSCVGSGVEFDPDTYEGVMSREPIPLEGRAEMTEPLTSMKILVCGSRTWEDREMILDALREFEGQDVTVIHGGARGADQMAGEIAESFDFNVQVFLPDWSRGRQAGFDRNIEMLDEEPDLVLAFRKNKSNGTTHTINEAHKRGIKCAIFDA